MPPRNGSNGGAPNLGRSRQQAPSESIQGYRPPALQDDTTISPGELGSLESHLEVGIPGMRPNPRHLDSYLAGLFDGEGYISIACAPVNNWRRTPSLLVGCEMSTPLPLEMLQARFGGKLSQRSNRPMMIWTCGGRLACQLPLEIFARYCILKRPQAQFVLDHIIGRWVEWDAEELQSLIQEFRALKQWGKIRAST